MSNNNNNNPHGHTNQPPAQNPSWNPLQIPSYIPRQPQLAHMSNERSMVRSPLAWHAPAPPPDSIYNFMSGSHKNLDHQMNPLLSPYVRGPSPFDSMDLSVQSTRSSSSPLSKSGVGSSQHPVLPHDYGHKQQQQQQQPTQHPHANQHQHQQQQQPHSQQAQMHAPNNYTAHLPASSPHSLGHSQSHQHQQQQPPSHQAQQQQKQRQPHLQLQPHAANINPHIMQQSAGGSSGGSSSSAAANTKYLNSNGGDCDMLPPSLVGAGSGSGGGGSTSTSNIVSNPNSSSGAASTDSSTALYMRESESAAHMQESYTKISTINRNYENEPQSKVSHKPVELVNKDCNFTMSSNKMSHPQQVSPKKHSPLRNYHHPAQHPQQQQQQTHYSSPHTISHNGPHTPPTPQSPVSQQQQQQQPQTSSSISTSNLTTPTTTTMQQLAESRILQNTGNLLDYNQLHLQHNNSYQPPQHAAAAVTAHPHQQQMPSTPQQPSPHHHHNQQQQQKQQQQQTHHPHFVTHRQQQQQQSQLQPQQHQSPQLQHQQQIHHHHHHPHHQHPHLHHQVLPTAPPSTSQSNLLTNLDSFTSQSNSKMKELDMATKTAMTDLSATASLPRPAAAAAMAAHLRAQASTATGTFAMRNTSPDNIVTSNEDSVDSNSNSSRARRKRKPNKLARRSSNDSEVDDESAGSVCLKVASAAAVAVDAKLKHERRKPSIEPEQREREQTTRCSSSSNTSPKQTLETLERRSPIKVEITSPSSFLEPNRCPLPTVAHNMPPLPCSAGVDSSVIASTNATKLLATVSRDESGNDKTTVENGCNAAAEPVPQTTTTTPRKSDSDNDVETIDKIAEMIAKTGNQEVVNCNSSSSTRSGGGASGACCLSIDSPKTKKQRQALKLRSAEQHNSNSNCSTNSNSYNESLPEDAGAANDNAVLAEELRKVKREEEGPSKEPVQNISLNNVTQASTLMPTTQMAPTTTTMTTKSSLSPPTFIHSCSSSNTSSSSCSNSSRSSGANKENKIKTALELRTQKSPEEPPKEQDAKHHNIIKALEEEADCVDVGGEVTMSPKREVVLKYDHPGVESKTPLINSCTDSKKELIKSPAKSCFEEVENKLEEMFAGIEDEPPPPTIAEENTSLAASNVSEVANDLSLALELVTNVATSIKENKARELSPLPLKLDKTPPTKAAKKSTIPSLVKLNTVTPPTRITPPRRRLSVLVEPINLAESTKQNRSAIDDQQPTTSAAAAAAVVAAMVTKAPPPKETSSLSPKKQCKTKNIQKGTTTSKSKGSAGAGAVAGTSAVTGAGVGGGGRAGKGKVNNRKPQQQQQQKKHKGKQQRDSEDEETTHVRESNGGVNSGCGGGGGGANTGNQSTTVIGDARYKSPYILVKTDGSITVINAPTAEDVGAEKQTKVKKAASHHRGYAQNRKNLRGMHSSTLSNKYDADTADMTWICVFCKRGPHRMGLGDLFGPYLVSSECEEYRAAVRAPGALDLDALMDNKRRRIDMVQYHPRNLPVVPAGISGWQGGASTSKRMGGGYNKKKKKSTDDPAQLIASATSSATATANTAAAVVVTAATTDVLIDPQTVSNINMETLELNPIVDSGMCKVSETSYEVWLHEDCAVWAPAVFLVGVRVMGLDAAVWNSTRYQCTICGKAGAIICCLHRDCHAAAHLPCARETQWNLDESNFKVFCHKHTSNNSSTTITSTSNAKVMNATLTSKTTIAAAASASSVLAELLSRPPAKPTSSNLPPRRYS